MSADHIWKEIQNSMAIEGYEISDAQLEKIKREYESSGESEIVHRVLAEVEVDGPFEEFKSAWQRISKEIC